MTDLYTTPLKGSIALSTALHNDHTLLKDKTLYKFIWITEGTATLVIDHIKTVMEKNDILALTPLQHIAFEDINGKYNSLLFNSNFYCIFGHDNEVSCNGLLFRNNGSLIKIHLNTSEADELGEILGNLEKEYSTPDNLQEEMLRIMLKRFIIKCTRIAKNHLDITPENENMFDIARQFYILVDMHFKETKKVMDYATMLNRSPKTLTNIFANCKLPSPLQIIHQRTETEIKRLLLYSKKSAKEIADILGFEDISTLSRFFKKQTGESISEFRKATVSNRE
jgi:AraC family transcriptional regulator, transcriptional activator of pobA